MNVLIAYASQHGSTSEVAQFIGDVLKEHDINVTVSPVEQVQSVAGYDAFVLGSPIYGGMWLTGLSQFIEKFKVELAAKPTHLWIMCIRVLEADGLHHALQEYVYQPTLHELGVEDIGVFAGKLDLTTIDWNERWTLAARYDGQALPATHNGDYRDWETIRVWAERVRDELMPV